MRFDLEISRQSKILEHKFKASLYQNLNKAAKKNGCMRLSGLSVGVVSGLSTIITRIALILENVLKGLLNIIGSPCLKQCKLKTGFAQLFFHMPKSMLFLPGSIFSAVVGLGSKTIYIGIDPVKYSQKRWFTHDPQARKEQQLRDQKAQIQEQKARFDESIQLLENNPENIAAMKFVAHCYENGQGTEKNPTKAFELYKKAAKLGDVDAMNFVGIFYQDGKGVEKKPSKAFKYHEMAAQRGNCHAMVALGLYYESGLGVAQDDAKAFHWYKMAAQEENSRGMFHLGRMFAKAKGGVEKDIKQAVSFFRKAAEKGESDAKAYLSVILMKYHELEEYPNEWYGWFRTIKEAQQFTQARSDLGLD